ncbi:hypothetical protein [Aliarcobacter thereius]|uniref:WYL domain-containing protein n=1 Tax=Aliarcobacter thereius LMG 24486 TaxID=1032240 RepID=A0A1C7WT74_9BACT|nr:hypothetical protein [Aliarcobacter thereius]OCL95672.1 hypothetical protein AA347_01150 [Aliarcobacter thereius LMG 24486]QBF16341.1 hypothetical protein ATH_1295 [Aliarcobacter thereius LMG 24486]TLS91601.1 hypothetical protein FE244_08790 [Aliarcobacter thereius]
MSILSELKNYLKQFDFGFEIDTIRIDFLKSSKKSKLDSLGRWSKIRPNHQLFLKLKRRYELKELTTVHQLENHNIYYFNSKKKNYDLSTLVVYGLHQHHKAPPPVEIVNSILSIMQSSVKRGRNLLNLDVCFDMKSIPDIATLKQFYYLTDYKKQGNTFYINDTNILSMDRICIYNKALKNSLNGTLWRIEATISIPNFNCLALPISEFIEIINLANGSYLVQNLDKLKLHFKG